MELYLGYFTGFAYENTLTYFTHASSTSSADHLLISAKIEELIADVRTPQNHLTSRIRSLFKLL